MLSLIQKSTVDKVRHIVKTMDEDLEVCAFRIAIREDLSVYAVVAILREFEKLGAIEECGKVYHIVDTSLI